MLAGLVLIPVLNLLTPLFGVALMVHVHKALARRALPDGRPGGPPRLEV
jgi:CysZ protein